MQTIDPKRSSLGLSNCVATNEFSDTPSRFWGEMRDRRHLRKMLSLQSPQEGQMAITIRVREFMTLRSGAAAWPLAAWVRQPAKMLRVALLVMLTLFAAPVVGE